MKDSTRLTSILLFFQFFSKSEQAESLSISLLNSTLIKNNNVTLVCKIPNFKDDRRALATWKKGNDINELTECTSTEVKSGCSTKNTVDNKYHFKRDELGIYVTISFLDVSDATTYTCTYRGRQSDYELLKSDILVPPELCKLEEDKSKYLCKGGCLRSENDLDLRWLSVDTEITNLTTSNVICGQNNCTSNTTTSCSGLPKYALTESGNISCSCGLKGLHQYTIRSNSIYHNKAYTDTRLECFIVGVIWFPLSLLYVPLFVVIIVFIKCKQRKFGTCFKNLKRSTVFFLIQLIVSVLITVSLLLFVPTEDLDSLRCIMFLVAPTSITGLLFVLIFVVTLCIHNTPLPYLFRLSKRDDQQASHNNTRNRRKRNRKKSRGISISEFK